ncbi:conserved hypothetical protein [Culex quinquefasciatus]|uniref:Odorant receptor n=1 Tax=Culex quinquefasciatus TaxID=7176 RepID=B0WNZ9_CULQU|nr:conserved hypothetical protein [Culex quinquefasciatus]|eukprot:XP_001850433.1 conserved hypothetical protein [Culex quinquefasciatus]
MNLLDSLARLRLFRFEFFDTGAAYRAATARLDQINALVGVCMFNARVSRAQPAFIWGIISLLLYVYLAFESTIWYRDNIDKLMMCITTHGFSLQMASKVYTFILNRNRVIEINEINLKYFGTSGRKAASQLECLKPSAKIANILITMTIFGYVTLTSLIIAIPVIYGLIVSKKVLPMGYEVVHSTEWPGYIVNLLFQINCMIYVSLTTITSDGTFILFLMSAIGQIDAILGRLSEFSEQLKQTDDDEQITGNLKQILRLHQHHQRYMRKLDDLFSTYFMIAIISLYFCMSVCLASFLLV